MTPKEALSCPFILKNSTKCTLQSPSRLNSSFDDTDEFGDFSEGFSSKFTSKFYDEDATNNFLGTLDEGIIICDECEKCEDEK